MEMTSLRKAAIVLASLAPSAATAVCKQMSSVEAEMLISEVSSLGQVPSDEQDTALAEFRFQLDERAAVDGAQRAEQLMASVLGRRHNEEPNADREAALRRLQNLNALDPVTIRAMLAAESPQMAAVVLGQLSGAKAAQVVRAWPEDERADLTLRVARLGPLAPGVVEAIGEVMGGRSFRDGDQGKDDMGVSFVVTLLEEMDRTASKGLLEELRTRDGELADEAEDLLFTFDNIAGLSDESLQVLLRTVDNVVIARALKGTDESVSSRLMENLSSRGREMLEQEMELMGPVLVTDMETAQRDMVRAALDLEEAGEITLSTEEQAYV
jgi:flagellar motor switch protein FliG